MATVTEVRYTPEDLLRLPFDLMPELIDGRLVEREPKGQRIDALACNFITLIHIWSKTGVPGVVNGANGSYQIFPDDPHKVRIPDASFTRRDRLPDGQAFEGHCRVVPDLVVEFLSPKTLAAKLHDKLIDFLSAGVPWILVVDPRSRTAVSYRDRKEQTLLRVGDVIRGGDVLPGFECPVADLFN